MAHADLYYREIINNGKEACSGKNSKNTELTIRFIGAVYDHVFVSKHVPSDGYRTFGKSYDMKCTLFTGHPVRRVHFALYD